MEQRQQRQIDEAAEKFAEALEKSYRSVAESAGTVRERNAELTRAFFESVIDQLRVQLEMSVYLPREALGQMVRQQQDLLRQQQNLLSTAIRDSARVYADLIDSVVALGRPISFEAVSDAVSPEALGDPGGLSDEEAQEVAERVVREVRRELASENEHEVEGEAPSPKEVREILSSRSDTT